MAIQLIPLQTGNPDYTFVTTFGSDATHYVMHVYWNDRDEGGGAWYFDVLASDETPIATGIKIVLGAFLGRSTSADPFKSGAFVAYDTSGKQRDAGYDDVGTRVVLYYFPVEDIMSNLAALAAA